MKQHCCGPTCSRTGACACICIGCKRSNDQPRPQNPEHEALKRTIAILSNDNERLSENLTTVQARCTEQELELRTLRKVIAKYEESAALPGLGWDCKVCGAFNGSLKDELKVCRCCERSRGDVGFAVPQPPTA